ncbi:MAG TPA: type IV pilus twitching motility protein PilT [Candidatus Saccharimonadales bacterium]|nr:type IV pilus twitching motility protein PilT [Candidatus Saccharimonadales bacterium]
MQSQPKIEILLEQVIKQKASDIHLQVGLPPMLRINGALRPLAQAEALKEEVVEQLLFSLMDEDQKKILLRDKELDFSFAFGDLGRFRVNAFHERGNLAAALRLIPNDIPQIEQLGLPPMVTKFADYPRGLVLVTGPTGSGKSTTLAALIEKINNERSAHIITVEDPIEYTHQSKKSAVVQREVHYDTYSFSSALRASLREDPDVVLVGEMRDLETIAAAITIAETGHLVLATLHTNSAAQSIDRMIDVFPPHQQPQIKAQIGNVLQAICSQRLVPNLQGGRSVAAEVLIATPAVRNIIRDGKNYQLDAVIQTGTQYGMQSMDATLVRMIHAGIISYDEARNHAVDLTELDRLMREG